MSHRRTIILVSPKSKQNFETPRGGHEQLLFAPTRAAVPAPIVEGDHRAGGLL